MKWLKDRLEMLITIGAAIAIISGGIAYFATAKDLKLVDLRLDQKIVNDAVYDLQRQLTQLERQYGSQDCAIWQGKDANRDAQDYQRMKEQLKGMRKRRDVIIEQVEGKQ